MQKPKAVVLLSGGLDSVANLYLGQAHVDPVLAITVDYGQRAARKETESARFFSEKFKIPHRVLGLPWVGELGQSALTHRTNQMPEFRSSLELDSTQQTQVSATKVWVPNRNGLLIHVAATFAESLSAHYVVLGFNREEAQTFPDNSQAYATAVSKALEFSTQNHVQVKGFTTEMSKTEIVKELIRIDSNFPWEKLWSCYEDGPNPCGRCESCRRLLRAKQEGINL